MFYIEGKPTKLKPGDIAIFHIDDRVMQFVRKGQCLKNRWNDDKTQFSNSTILTEDLCTDIAAAISITHGFGFLNVSGVYRQPRLFYFKFLKLKK